MSTRLMLLSVAGVLIVAGCSRQPEGSATNNTAAPQPQTEAPAESPQSMPVAPPDTIVAERGGFVPEGVEYDRKNHRFLTGSLTEGTIFEIHDDGRLTPAVTDPELRSSVGIEVDEPRDRLLVANSDRAALSGEGHGQAKLGVFNLESGDAIAMVDLAQTIANPPEDAKYFANDVTVADDGSVYVTDTQQNVIYRVDPDYQASVFYRFHPMEDLAINGIVYDQGTGSLLVGDGGNGKLYRVPLDDPESVAEVTLPQPIPGADGIVWAADGNLVVVSNSQGRVVALTSDDSWQSAQIVGVAPYQGQATTAAAVGDAIYIVHPHFADDDPPMIERVHFQAPGATGDQAASDEPSGDSSGESQN